MKKKAILLGSVAVMLAASLSVGGMLAYFTDTDEKTNTFTAGNVDITLTETAAEIRDADSNAVVVNGGSEVIDADGNVTGYTYHLFPGQAYAKVPVVTVEAGSENAYLAATVTIAKGATLLAEMPLIGPEPAAENDPMPLLTGGIAGDYSWTQETWQDMSGAALRDAEGDLVIFAVMEEDKTADTATITFWFLAPVQAEDAFTLFEQLNVPAEFDNAEMALLDEVTVGIKAYAVQTVGFDDALAAMRAAFPTEFPTPPAP